MWASSKEAGTEDRKDPEEVLRRTAVGSDDLEKLLERHQRGLMKHLDSSLARQEAMLEAVLAVFENASMASSGSFDVGGETGAVDSGADGSGAKGSDACPAFHFDFAEWDAEATPAAAEKASSSGEPKKLTVQSIDTIEQGEHGTHPAADRQVWKSLMRHDSALIKAAKHSEFHLRVQRALKAARHNSRLESYPSWVQRMVRAARKVVESQIFESIVSSMILLNTAFYGYEVQYAATNADETPEAFFWTNVVFNVFFLLELLLRIFAQRSKFFTSPEERVWNAFDTALVTYSLVELANDAFRLRFLRLIRIAKTLRLLRLVRIMRFFRSLRLLVVSMASTLRSLFWTMVLLVSILWLFAIIFTQAVTEYRFSDDAEVPAVFKLNKFYGSIDRTMLTLYASVSGGISWLELLDPIKEVHMALPFVFVVYVAFTYFAVLNVVTGMFCQTAIESANQDQQEVIHQQQRRKAHYVSQLSALFRMIDHDCLGKITVTMFEKAVGHPDVQAFFTHLDLTVTDAWELFKLLDVDGSHVIDIEEFVAGCLQLKGNARSVEIALLRHEMRWMMSGLRIMVTNTHNKLLHASKQKSFARDLIAERLANTPQTRSAPSSPNACAQQGLVDSMLQL